MTWTNARITAFGSTRRANVAAAEDPQLQKLVEAGTSVCTIFGKTSTMHVTEILRTSLDMNLEMIEDSLRYLVASKRMAIYDAEHFFDGYKLDSGYALATLRAAQRGGASTLVLCDTNGGSMPWEVDEIVRAVRAELGPDIELGAHVHDDGGCGVANTLAAVRAGVRHVQGTINGYGERCGNANLCSIIPDIELKLGYSCLPKDASASSTTSRTSWPRWPTCRPTSTRPSWGAAPSRTRVACTWRPSAATPPATSTSTRSWWATSAAWW
jgi:2-isopropylmalate synthase